MLLIMEVNKIISRKIISASVSGSIFAILLGLIVPNPFGETISSLSYYLFAVVLTTPVYLMYSFPAILIYGVLTSIISDKIGQFISTKLKNEKSEMIFSCLLHVVFGLILLLYSLGASILFFIIDRVLQKKSKEYTLSQAIKSLAIPLAVWLIFMGVVYLEHIVKGS
jgi:ABC-type dipeptide/oligopeptide/nickel transport system permease component